MEKWMQVDVKNVGEKYTTCNLYCDGTSIQVVMLSSDYELLKDDGFLSGPVRKEIQQV